MQVISKCVQCHSVLIELTCMHEEDDARNAMCECHLCSLEINDVCTARAK